MSATARQTLAYVRVSSAGVSPLIHELNKFPAYIGKDAGCDVKLEADKTYDAIADKHAQLLRLSDGRFRLVNLTSKETTVRTEKLEKLAGRGFADLSSGDFIEIGVYTLQVLSDEAGVIAVLPGKDRRHDATALPRVLKSRSIELRLAPQKSTTLGEGGKVVISTFIKNIGASRDVKFEIDVIGIDNPVFYEIDEGPTLNPGAEQGVTVSVLQPAADEAIKLPPGDLRFGIRVSAQAYSGQPAEEVVTINVLPVYKHDLVEDL